MSGEDKKRILFVDHDERLRGLCSEMLTGAGYSVEVASSGAEAFGKIREAAFDIVITGLRHPGLDGIGLYLDTLKIYSDMRGRFIFMAEEACAGLDGRESVPSRQDRYLVKPLDIRALLREVERLTGANLSAFFARYRQDEEGRRAHRRLCWAEDCRLWQGNAAGARPLTQTTDISRGGMRIRYMGSPMRQGSAVGVSVKSLDVSGRAAIAWSRRIDDDESASGLSLSEPMAAAALSLALRPDRAFIPPLVSGAGALRAA